MGQKRRSRGGEKEVQEEGKYKVRAMAREDREGRDYLEI